MIDEVMRLSAFFASMMACCSFALAIAIAATGVVDRKMAGCYGCLEARAAFTRPDPAEPSTRSAVRVAVRDSRAAL